ncbi:hypothetical protein GGD63_005837 [Bradyrhizobium sp. cir1]|nr:hypothetical protein [Bradyrhizobium sp. cir1]
MGSARFVMSSPTDDLSQLVPGRLEARCEFLTWRPRGRPSLRLVYMSPAIDVPSILVCRPCLNRARPRAAPAGCSRLPCLIPGTRRHQPNTAEGERLKWTSTANQSGSACLLQFQARSDLRQPSVDADPRYRPETDATRLLLLHWRSSKWLSRRGRPMPTRVELFFTSVGWAVVVVVILHYLIFGPG